MKQVVAERLIRILSLLIVAFRKVNKREIPELLTKYFSSIKLSFQRTFLEKNIDTKSIHEISQISLSEKLEALSDYFENLCRKTDLVIKDRIIILLHIILFVESDSLFGHEVVEILKALALKLNLTQEQFEDLFKFVTLENIEDIQSDRLLVLSSEIRKDENQLEGSWIESNIPSQASPVKAIEVDSFKGTLIFMYLEQLKSFIVKWTEYKSGKNSKHIADYQIFNILGPGDELQLSENYILEYHDIKKNYLQGITKRSLRIAAENIEFFYNPPFRGLKKFSFREETGQLIGIIGQEGVGKTTLLKMIAGEMKPDKGNISINGFDLRENIYLLKGIIGNVTEEDMLFEELTVYENIYLTAKFFFSNLPELDLVNKINDLMEEIGLMSIRDVRIGSFSEKNIQPGQRRLVNIALELLREPDILLVDDANERLNMADSSKVIKVLHQYTFKGKLVITSISQTSESVFRMFDKIWVIDEGGFPIFQGSPLDAYNYFTREVKNPVEETNSTTIRHISPETILDLVNTRTLDACGNESLNRKYSPDDWSLKYHQYQDKLQTKISKSALPRGFLKTPNLETQFKYYSIRNFRTKFYQKRMLVIALFVGPLTAFVLGLILRNKTGDQYLFSGNTNLSVYYFTSILVSFFFGLIGSAREILKEKHILKKEEYLNFSRFSYVNSKITFLFIIAGIQTLLFAVTGNLLLGIHGMTLYFWFLLFSMASLGSVLGLIFSCSFRSDVVIYGVAIPVVLALQFFLGGGYISYKHLNLNEYKYTPLEGDLMPARWAYEAMVVKQFRDNKYEKNFYDLDRDISQSSFLAFHLLPELQEALIFNPYDSSDFDTLKYQLKLIRSGITQIVKNQKVFPFEYYDQLYPLKYSPKIAEETSGYLTYLEYYFYDSYDSAVHTKELKTAHLTDSLGIEGFRELKEQNYNYHLADMLTGSPDDSTFVIRDSVPVQLVDPIYQPPESNYGRAPLFLPYKMLNDELIDTYWFNASVIWLYSFVLYIILLIDLFNKTGMFFNKKIYPGRYK